MVLKSFLDWFRRVVVLTFFVRSSEMTKKTFTTTLSVCCCCFIASKGLIIRPAFKKSARGAPLRQRSVVTLATGTNCCSWFKLEMKLSTENWNVDFVIFEVVKFLSLLERPDYCKSSKETHGSYSFFEGPNAGLIRTWLKFEHFCLLCFKFSVGLIRMHVLFEGGSLSRIHSM